jgi:hypothetical protein
MTDASSAQRFLDFPHRTRKGVYELVLEVSFSDALRAPETFHTLTFGNGKVWVSWSSITQNGKPPSVKILFTITPQPVKTIAPIFVYVYFLNLLRSKSIKHMQFKFLSVLSPMPIHRIIRCLEHGWMEQDCSRRNPTLSSNRLLNGVDTCLSKVLRERNRVVEDYDRKRFGGDDPIHVNGHHIEFTLPSHSSYVLEAVAIFCTLFSAWQYSLHPVRKL